MTLLWALACAPEIASPELTEQAILADPVDLKAYFTSPGTDQGEERDAKVDDALVRLLEGARATADLAIYDLDHDPLVHAVLAAHARGVQVRVVGDGDEAEGHEALAAAGVPVTLRPEGDRIMHHKFAVVDGEHVWTGSTNWTWTGHHLNNNNGLHVRHAGLAADYTRAFELMAAGRFGNDKHGDRDEIGRHQLGDGEVEAWFSPQHEPVDRLVGAIEEAEHSLVFLVFSFTHEAVLDALIDAHERGVVVAGIFDESQAAGAYSVDEEAADAGLRIFVDGNENTDGWAGGKLHHKVLVVDRETVVTGSMNWSNAGNDDNDEDLLVLRQADIASRYQREFCLRVQEARPHEQSDGDLPPMLCTPGQGVPSPGR